MKGLKLKNQGWINPTTHEPHLSLPMASMQLLFINSYSREIVQSVACWNWTCAVRLICTMPSDLILWQTTSNSFQRYGKELNPCCHTHRAIQQQASLARVWPQTPTSFVSCDLSPPKSFTLHHRRSRGNVDGSLGNNFAQILWKQSLSRMIPHAESYLICREYAPASTDIHWFTGTICRVFWIFTWTVGRERGMTSVLHPIHALPLPGPC